MDRTAAGSAARRPRWIPGFDPEERWNSDVTRALRSVDVFLPNEVDLAAITRCGDTEASLRSLEASGSTCTVVKLGRSGAMARARGEVVHVPAFPVEPVDTTGAGDSFNAGFHAFLYGWPLRECLRAGNACGALSTRALGGTSGQPTAAELNGLIAKGVERR
jgi:sugar/nucleoside kinase (ribokinase family)